MLAPHSGDMISDGVCGRVNAAEDTTLDEYSVNRYETATLKLSVRFNIHIKCC